MIDGITKAKAALRRHLDGPGGRSILPSAMAGGASIRATRADYTLDPQLGRGGFQAKKMANFTVYIDDGVDPTANKQTIKDLKTNEVLKIIGHRQTEISITLICTDQNA